MSCKKDCVTRCSRKAGVELDITPKVLCSPMQKEHCEFPVTLDLTVNPRCTLVKAPCGKSMHNCHTRCEYKLLVDCEICPKIDIGCKHICKKEFEFSTAVEYKTKCLNPSSSSSSSSSCAPCKGKAPHKYRKSCKCASCNAWKKAH